MRIKFENALVLVIDFQEKLMPSIYNSELIINKTAQFLKGCRVLGLPLIVTQQYTKGLGETVNQVKDALGNFEYIDKTAFSCLGDEEFNRQFKAIDKKDIIITGVEAHICVQQTVLDLLEKEYNVFLAMDCIGSRFHQDREYAEKRMEQAGAVLTTMESLLFDMLADAKHPKRKLITEIIK